MREGVIQRVVAIDDLYRQNARNSSGANAAGPSVYPVRRPTLELAGQF